MAPSNLAPFPLSRQEQACYLPATQGKRERETLAVTADGERGGGDWSQTYGEAT